MDAEIQSVRLYDKIALLLQAARTSLARAVNHAMVQTYYEIGRMIVEEEQQGEARAASAKALGLDARKNRTRTLRCSESGSTSEDDRRRAFRALPARQQDL